MDVKKSRHAIYCSDNDMMYMNFALQQMSQSRDQLPQSRSSL